MVEVVSIRPLSILVANKKGGILLDDCCTKQRLLPLTLADGSVYYNSATTARMSLKLLSLRRPSWQQVTCLFGGLGLDI
jgi:hypothetical protein